MHPSKRPEDWFALIQLLLRREGLNETDAQDLTTYCLQAYHRTRNAYLWQETQPCLTLLSQQTAHVATSFKRKEQRRKRCLGANLHLLPSVVLPSPEERLHEKIEVEQWLESLPLRLQEVVRLRMEGYTCEEIAQQVGVRLGTVLGYLKEAKKRFLQTYPRLPHNLQGS